MQKHIFVLLLICFPLIGFAQKQDNQWYFSIQRAMSFASGNPVVVQGSDMWTVEGSASIADNDGNLLFYTDGFDVWDANNFYMPNGTGLQSATSPTQVLIVPFPASHNKYYIFHLTCPDPGICVPPTGLNYSVVDMQLNGGMGDIEPGHKDVPLIEEVLSEKVMAVKQGNGTDWWVITHDLDSTYIVFPVTADGIGSPVHQTIGNTFTNMSGEMEISPNGERLVSVDIQGFINLLDFDRCEGILSNPLNLSKPDAVPDNSFYGCAFSPNSEVLYVAEFHKRRILQYDLMATDIASSEDTVYNIEANNGIGGMQLGPDNKLYFGLINTGLGVINNPDMLGAGCDPQQTNLFSGNVMPLPTLPNYNLEAIDCNPTSVSTIQNKIKMAVQPNPVTENAIIHWDGFQPERLDLWNGAGYLLMSENLPLNSNTFLLKRNNMPAGIYFVRLTASSGAHKSEKIIFPE